MKYFLTMCYLTAIIGVVSVPAHATDYLLVYLQCTPSTCSKQLPPTTFGTATVLYQSACTGGLKPFGINGRIDVTIGTPVPCTFPYVPYAQVEQSRTQIPDGCGTSHSVDYVVETGEVFAPTGSLYYWVQGSQGCDNTNSGTTVVGSRPC
jgi:hypothetical protein